MYKNIVIPVDLSDKHLIKCVISSALTFANIFGAKLHMVHVMPDFGMKIMEDYLPKYWMSDQKKKCESLFEELKKKYIPDDISVEFFISRGAIYDEVINYSEKVDADLIMLAAVRPQLRDYMLGPNASKIVRHSAISVMVVRD